MTWIILWLFSIPAPGQSHSRNHLASNEIALVPGVVYDLGDRLFSFGIHGHYLRSPRQLSELIGLGVSIEYVSGDDPHFTAGPALTVRPWHSLVLLYSIGITRGKSESGQETEYFLSNHIELILDFDVGDHLHIGPTMGFNLSGHDTHISAGIHTGFSF